MRPQPAPAGARVIKRYGNRKLYDAEARRYVTLEDLARMLAGGAEVAILDQRSGEDITTLVLAQVILDGIRQRTADVPRQVLARLIRMTAGNGRRPAPQWPGPVEAAARARDEAERIAQGLIARGRLTLEEALALRQEIARSVQRLVTEAQHGLEGRLRGLLERSEREAGVSPALQTLKERLLAFETYLGEEPGAARRARRPRKAS